MPTDALELAGIVEVDGLELALEPTNIRVVADVSARVLPEQLTQGPVIIEEVGVFEQVVDAPVADMFQEGGLEEAA
ncbi:hypothetical protein Nepgr_018952 [Nepenthes gracilis]|uniref:Uncharacterized protein n=1 Tax=Nepenthes gracilis TaxID=150966 RepID=A0AAD3SUE1_NEPGR|nr:hypothetical protein Nepgr_018952 [Nepenthes gracilis]